MRDKYLIGSDIIVGAYPSLTSLTKSFAGPVKVWQVLTFSAAGLALVYFIMPVTGLLAIASYVGGILVGLSMV